MEPANNNPGPAELVEIGDESASRIWAARHEFYMPDGVAEMMKGERFSEEVYNNQIPYYDLFVAKVDALVEGGSEVRGVAREDGSTSDEGVRSSEVSGAGEAGVWQAKQEKELRLRALYDKFDTMRAELGAKWGTSRKIKDVAKEALSCTACPRVGSNLDAGGEENAACGRTGGDDSGTVAAEEAGAEPDGEV
ncbi:hypothetical protein PENSPDRAFT_694174 [Peniophora sp. CONT]|nr:hypothetical protein PENSPDRAFT_694174 [Peniophora sp. CONT]